MRLLLGTVDWCWALQMSVSSCSVLVCWCAVRMDRCFAGQIWTKGWMCRISGGYLCFSHFQVQVDSQMTPPRTQTNMQKNQNNLLQVMPQISRWLTVHPFLSCHLTPMLILFSPTRVPPPPLLFWQLQRERWRSGFVCLIVCHENEISGDGWRDSWGEMQC